MSDYGIEATTGQLQMFAPERPTETRALEDGFGSIPGLEERPIDGGGAIGFGDALAAAVDDAATRGHDAYEMKRDFAAGRLDDLHGTMIAAEQAGISVKLVGSIRNKLLDAFQELWRINV
ncbi:MAG: flagellar hook-basal body complex protein FliE [Myxococcota bacterium]